jgi:haloacetate dehalogenase
MFPNFSRFSQNVGTHDIVGITGGSGPPLLLLHGFPQTHVMWHKLAPALAEYFTVIAADLTGYGDSGKPETDAEHLPYSKRAMARDMLNVMQQLGHETFFVAGHDRGGRVAHRLAVDHPESVQRLAVLDIAPTREMYATVSDEFARTYWHWYFLIQPAPFPERMILADTDAYLLHQCGLSGSSLSIFDPLALNAYKIAFSNPATVHAACEDYRAAASIDIEHDNSDDEHQRQIVCPLLVLWGRDGVIERCFDPLALWRKRARNVQGCALPGGHYLAEQHPQPVLEQLLSFFKNE